MNAYDSQCDFNWVGGSQANENGDYFFTLSAGTYFVRTDYSCGGMNNPQPGYINESWNSQGGAVDCSAGEPVVVQVAQPAENINFSLDHLSPGDINGDGMVNLRDAILALQILSDFPVPPPIFSSADVNGDGKIGMAEVLYIMQEVVSAGDPAE